MSRLCCIDGCGKPHDSNGYCGMHAQRVRRYGDPNYVTSNDQFRKNCRAAAIASKPASASSYLKLHGRHAHRVAAENKLGRPLLRGEIVHHIDGDKHNNAPENLRVMSQADHLREHHAQCVAARKASGGYGRKAR